MDERSELTTLLREASEGDSTAFEELYGLVYDELVQLARMVRRGKASETLNTTSLVHEAYFKLISSPGNVEWNDRAHFFAVAARAMRQVLVNAARDRKAAKRGGGHLRVTLTDYEQNHPIDPHELLALNDALTRLEEINERQARVIECRFFGGLSVDETAQALGISDRTVKRDWRFARAWLGMQLSP